MPRLRNAVLLSLLLASSCSRQTPVATAPDANDPGLASARALVGRENGDFYPLAVGNVWKYQRTDHAELRSLTGSVTFRMDVDGQQTRTIECTNPFEGRDWFIEIQRFRPIDGTSDYLVDSRRLRQDGDGLFSVSARSYELCNPDTRREAAARLQSNRRELLLGSITDPRTRAKAERAFRFRDPSAGQPSDDDTLYRATMLRYPLHVGAQWVWAANRYGTTTATVEAHEVLALPAGKFPAWRIRLRSTDSLPGESYLIWIGRAGVLAEHYHAEYPVLDEDGVVTGSVMEDRRRQLVGFSSLGSTTASSN